ncbi:cell division protein ZapA [Candidatus Nitrosacidococcus sp. I8]|uniref:cell division protein ZapA n=1 Tax=Candidatus Nitrosacidococcus sp. I8 TaxID=2942908 RepID=UPI002225D9EB|nr:cell division protein ZapA [Candidatus Nitrosacidococcus sp. I8]CAH9016246.1 Cell division protein ZapA [Candidatus Nitrosacidococcus sp. I8]
MSDPIQITLQISGKSYQVTCSPNEEESLLIAAQYLNKKIEEIKKSNKVVGMERVAVIAALNIAYDLIKSNNQQAIPYEVNERIQSLQTKVKSVLDESRRIITSQSETDH